MWAKNTVRVYGGGKADKIWKTIAEDQFQEPLKRVQTDDGWREGGRMEGVGENDREIASPSIIVTVVGIVQETSS